MLAAENAIGVIREVQMYSLMQYYTVAIQLLHTADSMRFSSKTTPVPFLG